MNIFLLHLVGKWISFLFVGVVSLFQVVSIDEVQKGVENNTINKHNNIIHEVIPYTVIETKNSKLPKDKIKVLEPGISGIVQKNEEENTLYQLREMVPQKQEIGTGPIGDYVGKLTGYTAECYGCSKVGNVACFTYESKKHSLIHNGITYQDREYGEVAILAAERSVFPCGTIITVTIPGKNPFVGVVLDTGGAMRKAWSEHGSILIDLALETGTEKSAIYSVTSSNVKYSVERFGW